MDSSEPIEALSAVTLLTAHMARAVSFYGRRVHDVRAGGSGAAPDFLILRIDRLLDGPLTTLAGVRGPMRAPGRDNIAI